MRKLSFFLFLFFFYFNVSAQSKTILLVAGHGLGKDCNHASVTLDGITYYENKEARILVDKIAFYLKQAGISYEIANEIVGDSFWSSDSSVRNEARECVNPNTSSCCGYRTSTLGTYSNTLLNHVDEVGASKYSLVLEVHFNGGGGNYSLVMGRDDVLRSNGLKISQAVVDSISYGEAIYGIDNKFFGSSLGTITKFYQQRSIPTYYLETVFMDNISQFRAYLNHKEKVAQSISDVLISLAPESKGGFTTGSSSTSSGRHIDPYPNIFGITHLSSFLDVGCNTIFFTSSGSETELKAFLDDLFRMIRILTPVIVLIFITLDYIKVIVGQEDSFKKANQKALKRISIGILIFFLPYVLDLLFHLFGLYDLSRCGIGG